MKIIQSYTSFLSTPIFRQTFTVSMALTNWALVLLMLPPHNACYIDPRWRHLVWWAFSKWYENTVRQIGPQNRSITTLCAAYFNLLSSKQIILMFCQILTFNIQNILLEIHYTPITLQVKCASFLFFLSVSLFASLCASWSSWGNSCAFTRPAHLCLLFLIACFIFQRKPVIIIVMRFVTIGGRVH